MKKIIKSVNWKKINFFTLMAVALLMLLPMTTRAQSDGFFRGSQEYDNRDASATTIGFTANNQTFGSNTYNIDNEQFGAPLDSGLLVMTVLGALYGACSKRKIES